MNWRKRFFAPRIDVDGLTKTQPRLAAGLISYPAEWAGWVDGQYMRVVLFGC